MSRKILNDCEFHATMSSHALQTKKYSSQPFLLSTFAAVGEVVAAQVSVSLCSLSIPKVQAEINTYSLKRIILLAGETAKKFLNHTVIYRCSSICTDALSTELTIL